MLKKISITEEVYNLLKNMKLPHESFEDTIERLCKSYSAENLLNWLETTDGWEDMTDEESTELNKTIETFRKDFKLREGD